MTNNSLKYLVFYTAAGYVGVLASDSGLVRITLPHSLENEALNKLSISSNAERTHRGLEDTVSRLRSYFAGNPTDFTDTLDFSSATGFRQAVWKAARLIPYGETRSYIWIARNIGKPDAARAVGQALGDNPFPVIVPCHRVVSADGKLGGFSGGLEMKRYLLGLEKAAIPK